MKKPLSRMIVLTKDINATTEKRGVKHQMI